MLQKFEQEKTYHVPKILHILISSYLNDVTVKFDNLTYENHPFFDDPHHESNVHLYNGRIMKI